MAAGDGGVGPPPSAVHGLASWQPLAAGPSVPRGAYRHGGIDPYAGIRWVDARGDPVIERADAACAQRPSSPLPPRIVGVPAPFVSSVDAWRTTSTATRPSPPPVRLSSLTVSVTASINHPPARFDHTLGWPSPADRRALFAVRLERRPPDQQTRRPGSPCRSGLSAGLPAPKAAGHTGGRRRERPRSVRQPQRRPGPNTPDTSGARSPERHEPGRRCRCAASGGGPGS